MSKLPSVISKLQGTWNIVALEVDGADRPVAGAQIVIQKNRFTSLGMGATYTGKLVVDDSKKPFALDLIFTAGPEKGNTNRGIFEFKGDSWRLCLQMTDGDRPKHFATQPRSGLALETFERTGKKKVAAGSSTATDSQRAAEFPAQGESVPELQGEWAMASFVTSGQALEGKLVKHGRRTVIGNQLTVTMMGQVMMKARFRVDKSQRPFAIDYLLQNGQTQQGICELAEGLLRVNIAMPGLARPTDFTSTTGDGRTLTSWRRIEKQVGAS